MKLILILFFLFSLLSPSVTAEEMEGLDILELLDMLLSNEWNGDFSSLNYKATDPDDNVTSGGNMEAWLDIVGWFNMSRINGTDYIYGDPANQSITEYNAVDILGWNDNMDWIKHDLLYDVVNDTLIVQDNITMLWHHSEEKTTSEGHTYIQKTYYYSYLTIYDSEIIPKQYNYTAANTSTHLIFYNNTFSPKTIINVPGKEGLFYIEYSYDNKTIKQNLMNAEIEKNPKGIEFINFTDAKKWDEPTGNLSHIAGSCIIKGANFSLEDLNISLRTPYRSFNVTDYNLTINNVSAGSCINPSMIPFIAVMSLLLFTLVIIIKQTWR